MDRLSDEDFLIIKNFALEKLGVSFSEEKKALMYARLRKRLNALGIPSFKEYIELVKKDKTGVELTYFEDSMTTNHTYFMRESEHFYYLIEQILPLIVESHRETKDLRLWCAGCSSGEEAYTIAMFVDMFFKHKMGWDTKILATDISNEVMFKAVKGIYNAKTLVDVKKTMIKDYFESFDAENVIVKKSLRDKICFRKNNLIYDEFKFSKPIQVIFCRNVMIYFNDETKKILVEKFYNAMEAGGFLFIGHSESISNLGTKFEFALPGIYRKPLN